MGSALLETTSLAKTFTVSSFAGRQRGKGVAAVRDVSFAIQPSQTLGLVGESGSGKTTVARLVLALEQPSRGQVLYEGNQVNGTPERSLKWFRKSVQAVFQDPFSSLNRRMRVGDIVGEPLLLEKETDRRARRTRIGEVMEQVGLSASLANRFPHEFSGGQRQRIAIARALSIRPKLIVLDEPVSALDVSIRAQVLNLLKSIQLSSGVSYLFIAHDLAVVEHMSHQVGVMYLGSIVEIAPSAELYARPAHPYTRALLSAVPPRHPRYARQTLPLEGEIPSPMNPPPGCKFHPRCPLAEARCRVEEPLLREISPGHSAACHFAEKVLP